MSAVEIDRRRVWMARGVRYGLPLALVLGGVLMIILGHGHVSNITDNSAGNSPGGASPFTQTPTDRDSMFSAIGVGAIIVAVMVYMIGWFMRMNVSDGLDRQREEAAREYFARTGRWPGEQGPRGPDVPRAPESPSPSSRPGPPGSGG